MRIPLLRFRHVDKPIGWWEWLFAPVMIPLSVGGLACLAGLSIVVWPVRGVFLCLSEWRMMRLMRARGRYIAWTDLEPHLNAGEGTLVIEQAQKASVRVWWSQHDLMFEASTPAPTEHELDYLRILQPHPFVSWCYERYLSAESGNAWLTTAPYCFPPGIVEQKFFHERFPKLRVLMTVRIN